MISVKRARELALSFDSVEEKPHFERTSFRIGTRIFMTLDEKHNRACLKLTPEDQDIFSLIDRSVIYPVPNAWGRQGWTYAELEKIKKDVFKEALHAAYTTVAHSAALKRKKG